MLAYVVARLESHDVGYAFWPIPLILLSGMLFVFSGVFAMLAKEQ
jgi:hypothetical protein